MEPLYFRGRATTFDAHPPDEAGGEKTEKGGHVSVTSSRELTSQPFLQSWQAARCKWLRAGLIFAYENQEVSRFTSYELEERGLDHCR